MLLLDSLTFVDEAEYRDRLNGMLDDIYSDVEWKARKQVALLPVQQIGRPPGRQLHDKPWSGAVDANTGFLEGVSSPSGSEQTVSQLLGKWISSRRQAFRGLNEMASDRVRKLILVTDTLVSGEEVIRYIRFLKRNRRFNSWLSRKWITLVVVAASATDSATNKLRAAFPEVEVKRWGRVQTFDTALWSYRELRVVERFCREYALKGKLALGWGEQASLEVYQHTLGNGLPSVLRVRRVSHKQWLPLFPLEGQGFAGDMISIAKAQTVRLSDEKRRYGGWLELDERAGEFDESRIAFFYRNEKTLLKVIDDLLNVEKSGRVAEWELSSSKHVEPLLECLCRLGLIEKFDSPTRNGIPYAVTVRGKVVHQRFAAVEHADPGMSKSLVTRRCGVRLQTTSWNYYPRSMR